MKRPSYRSAVAWIACNDDDSEMDLETIRYTISVALIADIFEVDQLKVARDVLKVRESLK